MNLKKKLRMLLRCRWSTQNPDTCFTVDPKGGVWPWGREEIASEVERLRRLIETRHVRRTRRIHTRMIKDGGTPCVYVGFKRRAVTSAQVDLHYGMTGVCIYDNDLKTYDFRPDGLNIRHLVNRRDVMPTAIV